VCTDRVDQLNSLHDNFILQGINNVKIIAVGKSQYQAYNWKWTDNNSIPVIVDPSPYNIWTDWGANKWDIFILDSAGSLYETFNINPWDENRIVNAINALLSTLDNDPRPEQYSLLEVFPNPFNPSTNIYFSLQEYGYIELKLFNISGQELTVLNNDFMSPGKHSIRLDGTKYSSGTYFINLKTNSFATTQKIILVK
tara:strand:- start:191 stop:781 length:591 start_codon:yes stop_codon:yes gene_type:complete